MSCDACVALRCVRCVFHAYCVSYALRHCVLRCVALHVSRILRFLRAASMRHCVLCVVCCVLRVACRVSRVALRCVALRCVALRCVAFDEAILIYETA